MNSRIKPGCPKLRLDHPLARNLQLAYVGVPEDCAQITDFSGYGRHGSPDNATNGLDCFPDSGFSGAAYTLRAESNNTPSISTGTSQFGTATLWAGAGQEWTVGIRVWGFIDLTAGGAFLYKGNNASADTLMRVIWGSASTNRPAIILRNGSSTAITSGLGNVTNNVAHVVLTWDGSVAMAYVNSRFPTVCDVGTRADFTSPLRVGRASPSGTSAEFTWEDLRVYDRCLTQDEIYEWYEDPWGVFVDPMQYWFFNALTDGMRWNLDASEIDLPDESLVSQWDDISPEANHVSQATESLQPVFRENQTPNGGPTVDFDGVDDALKTNITPITGNSPRTIYVVFRVDPTNEGVRPSPVCLSPDGPGESLNRFGITAEYGVRVSGANRVWTPPATAERWQLIQVRVGSAATMNDTSLRLLNVLLTVDSTTNGVAQIDTAEGGAAVGVYNLLDEYFNGQVSHILAFENAHTEAQRLAIYEYLFNKWLKVNQDFDTLDASMPMADQVVGYTQLHLFQGNDGLIPQLAESGQYSQDHQFSTAEGFMPQDADLSKFTEANIEGILKVLSSKGVVAQVESTYLEGK